MRQKHLYLLFPIIFMLVSSGSALAVTADRVLATVNNEVVTLYDFQLFMEKTGMESDGDTVDEDILKSLIEEKLMLQEAGKNDIFATDEEINRSIENFQKENNLSAEDFREILSEEGITLDDYRKLLHDNIVTLKVIDKEVNSKVVITHDEIMHYYENNKLLFVKKPEKFRIKAIFLKLSNPPTLMEVTALKLKSLRIIEQINKGVSFDKMMNVYSDFSSKDYGRLLGEFEKGELIPELDKKLETMKDNEVSGPVWTNDGVYILKLLKRLGVKYTPVSEVRDNIYAKLYEEKSRERFNEWLKKLWQNSSISIRQQ